jgi:hypothetical protein
MVQEQQDRALNSYAALVRVLLEIVVARIDRIKVIP